MIGSLRIERKLSDMYAARGSVLSLNSEVSNIDSQLSVYAKAIENSRKRLQDKSPMLGVSPGLDLVLGNSGIYAKKLATAGDSGIFD